MKKKRTGVRKHNRKKKKNQETNGNLTGEMKSRQETKC